MRKFVFFTTLITLAGLSLLPVLAENLPFKEKKLNFKIAYEQNQTYELYKKGRERYLTFTAKGYNDAIFYFNKAIELDKKFALAYAGLAEAKVLLSLNVNPKVNKYLIASLELEAFESAYISSELQPNIPESHRALSAVYCLQDRYKEGTEEAKKSIALNPNDAESYLMLWLNNIGNKEIKGNEDPMKYYKLLDLNDPVIKKALALNPGLAATYLELGVTSYFQDKYTDAISYLEKVKSLSPANDESYTFLGFIYLDLNKYDEASKNFTEALKLDMNNVSANYGLGVIYASYRNNEKAKEYYKKACELGDKDSCNWLKNVNEPVGDDNSY